jgi:AAHS family 4-hydroxybenzoate transporter-like MFS transporter
VKERRFDGTEQFFVAELTAARASIPALLQAPFTARTLFLWGAFFGNIFVSYAFFNWLPTVLAAAGLPVTAASTGSLAFNFGGVLVALLVAAVLNKFGSRLLIPAFAIVSIVSTYGIGQQAVFAQGASASTTGLYVLAGIAGGAITVVQVSLYAMATYVYPTVLRATGTGSATGVGRTGGILSAASGSVLFAFGLSGTAFFTGLAVVLIGVLIAVIGLRDQIPATPPAKKIQAESTAAQGR